jgi:hypothetical protein
MSRWDCHFPAPHRTTAPRIQLLEPGAQTPAAFWRRWTWRRGFDRLDRVDAAQFGNGVDVIR